MRRTIGILLGTAACLALISCSSPNEAKKEEPAKAPAAPPAPPKETVPDVFQVSFDTSKGPVVIEVHRDWAPRGADHFYSLVKLGFYDGVRFFRYHRNFIVQFGINGDPKTNATWANMNLPDDPVKKTNAIGTITYATAGPNTRSTQLFINLRDNRALDKDGFAPFGKIVTGMDVVENLYSGYGEIPDMGGTGPDPGGIERQGNDYLLSKFPRLDYIKKATIQ